MRVLPDGMKLARRRCLSGLLEYGIGDAQTGARLGARGLRWWNAAVVDVDDAATRDIEGGAAVRMRQVCDDEGNDAVERGSFLMGMNDGVD